LTDSLPGLEDIRVSFCVQASQYDKGILFTDKKDAEWESAEEGSLDASIDNRVNVRVPGDHCYATLDSPQVFAAKSRTLLLIPRGSICQVFFCGFSDDYPATHNNCQSLVRTACH